MPGAGARTGEVRVVARLARCRSPTANWPPCSGALGSTRKPPGPWLKFGVNSIARRSLLAYASQFSQNSTVSLLVADRLRLALAAESLVPLKLTAVSVSSDSAPGAPSVGVPVERGGLRALGVGQGRAAGLAHPPVVRSARRWRARDWRRSRVRRGLDGERLRAGVGVAGVVGHPQADGDGARGGVGARGGRASCRCRSRRCRCRRGPTRTWRSCRRDRSRPSR